MLWRFLSLLLESVYSHELIANKISPPRIWLITFLLAALERNWRIYLYMDGGRDLWCFVFGKNVL